MRKKLVLLIGLSSLLYQISIGGHVSIERRHLPENDSISGLNCLKTSIYKYYFSGENHFFSKNNFFIKLSLFKYLYKNAGVRCFMAEEGFSAGLMDYEFVKTGKGLSKEPISSNYFRFLSELRNFYLSLPENQKFVFVGIDIEKEPYSVIDALLMTLDSSPEENDQISELQKTLNNLLKKHVSEKQYLEVIDDLYEKVINSKEFESSLGSGFYNFKKIIISAYRSKPFLHLDPNDCMNYQKREMILFENLEDVVRCDTSIKIFGQFGRLHIPLQRNISWEFCSNWNSMVSMMQAEPKYHNRICSIPILYRNNQKGEAFPDSCFNSFPKENSEYSLTIPDSIVCTMSRPKFNYMLIVNTEIKKRQ